MTDRLAEIKKWCERFDRYRNEDGDYVFEPDEIRFKFAWLIAEVERLRQRLLSAAGDDLCRLTQEEIKELSAGRVQIPPKEEFLASCERFHAQIASEAGVMPNCLTLAQLIAENERLRQNHENLVERNQILRTRTDIPVHKIELERLKERSDQWREEVERLRKENENLHRSLDIAIEQVCDYSADAERWRRVRKNPYCLMQDDGTGTTWLVLGDDADAAVDAARRPEK